MLIDVDGVNPSFRDKTIEIVEANEAFSPKLSNEKGTSPQSLVFEVSDEFDVDDVVPGLKGWIKKSELGNIMMFRVTPHGQFMWMPKR